MERNYNNREFEQYVKKNADQYRMIPSEKVWKGINNALHTRRRWYAIGLSLLLLLTAVSVTWVMRSYPTQDKQPSAATVKDQKQSTASNNLPVTPVNPAQPVTVSPLKDINALLSIKKFDSPDNTLPPVDDNHIASFDPAAVAENNNEFTPATVNTETSSTEIVNKPVFILPEKKLPVDNIATIRNNTRSAETFRLLREEEKSLSNKSSVNTETTKSGSGQNTVYSPLTIESVVNSYKAQKIRKRISWQVYFAPTVSYRRLSANKSAKNSGPFADPISYPFTALTDINKAVTHKPDMGLELGFSTRYPIARNLKLRAGLQFNINRYDIKAFVYNGEQATINLNGGDGNNSVTAWTYYRNYNGYKSDWLKNYYFSVSAPIGAELMIFGNKKTSFGIAGTIQPTYILRDRAYLISTDYKNYAKVPWLVRRMNVNTSFETFITYMSRNKTQWQIGPQVRYQVLSSFNNKYPVRENLFDFGLKVGVTLN